MTIELEKLPRKHVETVFDNGVASIDMTVLTAYGTVFFEGYIRGEFVPYSKSNNIHVTAMMVNDALAKYNSKEAKINLIERVLADCEVEIEVVYPTEILTKQISNEKLMECAEKLVDSGAVPSCDLSRYAPLSGNMCKYKLGINL